jgi:hypothetical protein
MINKDDLAQSYRRLPDWMLEARIADHEKWLERPAAAGTLTGEEIEMSLQALRHEQKRRRRPVTAFRQLMLVYAARAVGAVPAGTHGTILSRDGDRWRVLFSGDREELADESALTDKPPGAELQSE